MELKQLVKQFSYRIEPKPEGGFIARSTDPTVPALEASTREELQRQIAEKFSAAISQSFPGLKIPVQTKTSKFEFNIERKPDGGFSVHSTELGGSTDSPVNHEKMDHFAEELLGFVDKHFPDLKGALIEKAMSQGQIPLAKDGSIPQNALGALANTENLLPTNPMANVVATVTTSISRNGKQINGSLGDVGRIIDNNPITPQAGGNWKLFRFLLVALGLAVFAYFVLHHG
jgi:hypothetical protein